MDSDRNIILTGFMGTGKTETGRILASRLGFHFLDTDELIEERSGMAISRLFETKGESEFRSLERDFCRDLAGLKRTVVATGGGMPLNPENRRLLNAAGPVFNLRARPADVLARIPDRSSRPLLCCDDPEGRIADLLALRTPAYLSFPFQVDTSDRDPSQIAAYIESVHAKVGDIRFLAVNVPNEGGYCWFVGEGALGLVPAAASFRGLSPVTATVADGAVVSLYLDGVLEGLRAAGFQPFSAVIPSGEEHKTLAQVAELYTECAARRLDRKGALIALGGGVTGDTVGFAAATYMRGVSFIQCPTTLLAMIDAGVGGKTGVDLPAGKNLVGAFKQPLFVAADTVTLRTLPRAEIVNGMVEFIKHAIIGDAELFKSLEASPCEGIPSAELIARSVSVKIAVVESDPLEQGRRAVLNLGHTVGHALEKCTDYRLSHGSATAVGTAAAARISVELGMCSPDIPERVERVLLAAGLPVRFPQADRRAVINALASDKKTVEGLPRFVMIREIGTVEHGITVPEEILDRVLAEVLREV